MLCLSRKENESIEIIKDGKVVATIVVVKVLAHKCRLGIKADDSVTIMRTELNEPRAA